MKKKKLLSWILSLILVLSVFNIPIAGVYGVAGDLFIEKHYQDEDRSWRDSPSFSNMKVGESIKLRTVDSADWNTVYGADKKPVQEQDGFMRDCMLY